MCNHPCSEKKEVKVGKVFSPDLRHRNGKLGATKWRLVVKLHRGSRLPLRLFDPNVTLPSPFSSPVTNSNSPPIHESTNQPTNQPINQSNSESIKLGNQSISHLCISITSTNKTPHHPLAWLQARLCICVSQLVRRHLSIHLVGPYATLI